MPQYQGNTPIGQSYFHISNAGTKVVKTTGGNLDGVIINGGSVGATLALFDQNTTVTGTVAIGTITVGGSIVSPVATTYNLDFANGLAVVSTGTIDVTFRYR